MKAMKVGVMGAGAIGCFVGGRLAASGVPVHFVGRPRVLDALRLHGLTLSDLEAPTRTLPPQALSVRASCTGLAAGLVLLTVKSGATEDAARELAAALPAGTLVLSLQNGIGNAAAAQRAAPGLVITAWLASPSLSAMCSVSPPTMPPGGCTSTWWQMAGPSG